MLRSALGRCVRSRLSLVDPVVAELEVDLAASRDLGQPVVRLLRLGSLV